MENSQEPQTTKKASLGAWLTLVVGILATITAVLFFIGALMLDLIGEKAIGQLSNIAECTSGRTCWTGQMDFTTQTGQQITFHPLTHPTLFNIDPLLRGRTYLDQPDYEVRYLASYPQLAKVKLAFFLEYINHVLGLCGGTFLFMIGSALTKPAKAHRPLVIDLSKRKK